MEYFTLGKLLPIFTFIFIASITPGPNNLMLAASGMNFGLRRTVPHIGGIFIGFNILVLMAAMGLNQLLLSLPGMQLSLRILASVYLLYLAWKIFGINIDGNTADNNTPISLLQAGAFQFTNPKAWMMSTSAMALAIPLFDSPLRAFVFLVLTFALVGTTCNCVWVLGGVNLKRLLADDKFRRAINVSLAMLTVLTIGLFWMN